ncbi:MAG: hypothetical protein H6509_00105 [Bryobacterales bacterium]|nr:hypothetical protein [Bryobacterales bacterium]
MAGLATLGAARAQPAPSIDIWYGPRQRFGHLGEPQRWVSILGSAAPAAHIAELHYSLNGGDWMPLSKGPDLHRLASPGDFNVEIDRKDLKEGDNRVRIRAVVGDGAAAETEVALEFASGKRWPLPYTVDWSKVENIQDVTQIVDGHWRLEGGGIRPVKPYYDRVLAFGDRNWTDYAATVEVTFHSFPGKQRGGPHFGVNHAGITLRWRGHGDDAKQPHVAWYPLGAATEFTLEKNLAECRWRILPGPPKRAVWAEEPYPIMLGRPYWLKAEVKTMPDGRYRYRTKIWSQDRNELDFWAVASYEEPADDFGSGSLLLIAHNADVTFGRLTIAPV